MLKDKMRTLTYRSAMLQNKALFRNKVVIDVGAGTGVLSMFAVQAGAKHVYALEMSEMSEHMERVVAANGMSDKITVVKGLAEDVTLPEHADVLVSEWMGYALLFERMLDTVLSVRDRWLKPEGRMFPESASLHMALLSNPELYDDRITFWSKRDALYGNLDLSPLVPFAKECTCNEPTVEAVEPHMVASADHVVLELNLRSCSTTFPGQFEVD